MKLSVLSPSYFFPLRRKLRSLIAKENMTCFEKLANKSKIYLCGHGWEFRSDLFRIYFKSQKFIEENRYRFIKFR